MKDASDNCSSDQLCIVDCSFLSLMAQTVFYPSYCSPLQTTSASAKFFKASSRQQADASMSFWGSLQSFSPTLPSWCQQLASKPPLTEIVLPHLLPWHYTYPVNEHLQAENNPAFYCQHSQTPSLPQLRSLHAFTYLRIGPSCPSFHVSGVCALLLFAKTLSTSCFLLLRLCSFHVQQMLHLVAQHLGHSGAQQMKTSLCSAPGSGRSTSHFLQHGTHKSFLCSRAEEHTFRHNTVPTPLFLSRVLSAFCNPFPHKVLHELPCPFWLTFVLKCYGQGCEHSKIKKEKLDMRAKLQSSNPLKVKYFLSKTSKTF